MDCYALIDYDNLLDSFQTTGLVSLSTRLRTLIDSEITDAEDVYIRLYGGWYGSMGLTNRGTRLAQEISANFPVTTLTGGGAIRRTHCEIASSLVDSHGQVLPHTFRERPGIRGKLTYTAHGSCSNSAICSAAHVARWSRGVCPHPGCQVKATDIFKYHEQKLVDTLLCCDLIALSARFPRVAVFAVSDDDDMVPAFLMAGQSSPLVWHVQMRQMAHRPYAMILQQHNVRTAGM